MSEQLPDSLRTFKKRYPDVWRAFTRLGDRCHGAGPLDEKTRRLVKVALALGAGLEGGTHSAVRNALAAGATPEEIQHVVVLSATTLGWPATMRGWTWVQDVLGGSASGANEEPS
jgi:alkylhydroperoxidase/carboxymuconolactone decarboxylase family protein YurZ